MRRNLLPLLVIAAGSLYGQANSVNDAYQRGVALGNQQTATVLECLSHPSCAQALRDAQAKKDAEKAEKAQLKAEAQKRKDDAKVERQRQKTEIKLAKLRLQTEREAARHPDQQ